MNEVVAVKASVVKPDGVITLLDYNNKMASTMRDKTKGFISGVDRSIADVDRKRKEIADAEENIKRAEKEKQEEERVKKAEREQKEADDKEEKELLLEIRNDLEEVSPLVFSALLKINNIKDLMKINLEADNLADLFSDDNREMPEATYDSLERNRERSQDEDKDYYIYDTLKLIRNEPDYKPILEKQILLLINSYLPALRKRPVVAINRESDILGMIFDKAPKDIMLSVSEFLIGESKASKLFKENLTIKEYGDKVLEAEIEGRPNRIESALKDIVEFFRVSYSIGILGTYAENDYADDSEVYEDNDDDDDDGVMYDSEGDIVATFADDDDDDEEPEKDERMIDFSILTKVGERNAIAKIYDSDYSVNESIRIYNRVYERTEDGMPLGLDITDDETKALIIAVIRRFTLREKKYSFQVLIKAMKELNKSDEQENSFKGIFTQFFEFFSYIK